MNSIAGGEDPTSGDRARDQSLWVAGQLRRVNRFFARDYEWIDKLFEGWFQDESNGEIAAELRRELLAVTKKGEPFAGRFIDLEAFDSLTPELDWRHLVDLNP